MHPHARRTIVLGPSLPKVDPEKPVPERSSRSVPEPVIPVGCGLARARAIKEDAARRGQSAPVGLSAMPA